jgi:cell division protein FtsL
MRAGWAQLRARRSVSYWLLVLAATAFLSAEPALFLVLLALGHSALALVWIVMLARLLVIELSVALGHAQEATAKPPDPQTQ